MSGHARVSTASPGDPVSVITTSQEAEHTAQGQVGPQGVQEGRREGRYLGDLTVK